VVRTVAIGTPCRINATQFDGVALLHMQPRRQLRTHGALAARQVAASASPLPASRDSAAQPTKLCPDGHYVGEIGKRDVGPCRRNSNHP